MAKNEKRKSERAKTVYERNAGSRKAKGLSPAGLCKGESSQEEAAWAMQSALHTALCTTFASRKKSPAGWKWGEDTGMEGPQNFLQQMYL